MYLTESNCLVFQFPASISLPDGKANRTRPFSEPKGTSGAWANIKSKTQTSAPPACEENSLKEPPRLVVRTGLCYARAFVSYGCEDYESVVD
jgi:hypothetical protein